MKHMHAVVNITLPEDEFEEAEAKLAVRPIWEAFLAALTEAKVVYTAKRETTWARTKQQPTAAPTGARRGRKTRAVASPAVVPTVSVDTPIEVPGEAA